MAEIDYWANAFKGVVDEAESLYLRASNEQNSTEKSNLLSQIDTKVANAKSIKQSFTLELSTLHDKSKKRLHQNFLQLHDGRLKNLESEVKQIRTEIERGMLLAGGNKPKTDRDIEMSNDQYLKKTHQVQDKTQVAIDNTKNMIDDAKQVGTQTLETLGNQREQIGTIGDQIARMDNELQRANLLIKSFGKRIMTDRCIQIFAMVNIVAFILLIVFVSLNGTFTGGDPPETP